MKLTRKEVTDLRHAQIKLYMHFDLLILGRPENHIFTISVRDLVKFGFIPSFYIFYYFSTYASFSIFLISP